MRKYIGIILSLMLLITGCTKESTVYSNLYDEKSQEEIKSIFSASKEIDTVLDWAKAFNQESVGIEYKPGFVSLPKSMDYSSVYIEDMDSYISWINCRLTTFTLLKDSIHTLENGNALDPWLMFDVEAIETVPEFSFLKPELAHFITLFNAVSVDGLSTVDEHVQQIESAWKERKIEIDSPYSIVCVYLHSVEDSVRFVGHVGVLADTSSGLYFLEKYGNMAPFQVTRLDSKEQLKTYLCSRSDFYGDPEELDPILIENGIAI